MTEGTWVHATRTVTFVDEPRCVDCDVYNADPFEEDGRCRDCHEVAVEYDEAEARWERESGR